MNTTTTTTTTPTSMSFTSQFLNDNDLFLTNQLPLNLKTRLYDIFGQIEKEFELLYNDNLRLRAKLNDENIKLQVPSTTISSPLLLPSSNGSISTFVGNLIGSNNNQNQNQNQPIQPLIINTTQSSNNSKQLISPTATTTITTIKARNTTIFPKFTNNIMQTIKNSNNNNNNLLSNTTATTTTTTTFNNLNNSTNNNNNNNNSNNSTNNNNNNCLITTFKEQYQVETRFKQTLVGHKDGIFDINCVQLPELFLKNLFDLKSLPNNMHDNQSNILIGTASADYSSRLWLLNSNQTNGFCIQQYIGHQGSVNSIRFHPKFLTNNLILTASGDCQAHIWQFLLPIELPTYNPILNTNYNHSSSSSSSPSPPLLPTSNTQFLLNDDLVNNLYSYFNNNPIKPQQLYDETSTDNLLRTPLNRYKTHTDACIAADWLPDGDYIVTASWDRTSNIYDVETSKLICSLTHDDQLNNLNIHSMYNLILTASKDTTFKLWDIRLKQQTINIYHGHTRSVNSAIFIYDQPNQQQQTYNRIATASDDHTCKIWDLRHMKQAQCQINLNSSINRLCTQVNPLTNEVVLCLPLDNRDIKLYTLNGERITRLQRTRSVGHKRMITSICSHNNLLFSGSFDKQAICWSIDYNPLNQKQKQSSLQQTLVNINNNKNQLSTLSPSTTLNSPPATTTTTTTATIQNTSPTNLLVKKNSSSNVTTQTTTNSIQSQLSTTPLNVKINENNKYFDNKNSSLIIANSIVTTSNNKKESLLNKKFLNTNNNERIKI